jgi:hypothetical protein
MPGAILADQRQRLSQGLAGSCLGIRSDSAVLWCAPFMSLAFAPTPNGAKTGGYVLPGVPAGSADFHVCCFHISARIFNE